MLRPHGGRLVDRVVPEARRERLVEECGELPKLRLRETLVKDVENMAHGVYSPLEGPMVEEDYLSVLERGRLANDLPWTIPITIDLPDGFEASPGDDVALVGRDGDPFLAVLHVEDIYKLDRKKHALSVYGTLDPNHPGVVRTAQTSDRLVGGRVDLVRGSKAKFPRYRLWPLETRVLFRQRGWRRVVGFQTRNVPHRGHEFLQKAALAFADGVFINPLVGWKKPGDYRDEVIVAAYETLIRHYYPRNSAVFVTLEMEMRYAGPREAVFHAIVRKNFGCTHFIVGRDHAGVGNYYDPYEAQRIFDDYPDLGITPMFFTEVFYCRRCGGMAMEKTCPHGESDRIRFSGTMIRRMLKQGLRPPEEIMRPEVVDVVLKWGDPFVR